MRAGPASAVPIVFPVKPPTEDARRSELLRLMGVPDHQGTGQSFKGVYVLGCFARYVTVYAQQVRALNLVDTLAKAGLLRSTSRVAVIGAGIAGLTVAAASATRGAGSVQVFEKLAATMRLQRSCEKRFIHPHIYDWPEVPEAIENETGRANLPLMDWEADRASDVVEKLDACWNDAVERSAGRLHTPRFDCKLIKVGHDAGRPFVQVESEDPEAFDLVILAVGFGLDRNRASEGYWADTALDAQEIEKNQSWFVSGYGDGALTDLMRLCIRDFRHGNVIKAVDLQTRNTVGGELMAAERRDAAGLAAAYKAAASKISPALKGKFDRRGFGKIWLNCSEDELFSQRSSVLNRLICAYLALEKRFEFFPGKLALPVESYDAGHRVRVEGGASLEVDEVIVRHGPDRALQLGFAEIWTACAPLAREWQAARQHEDWTRSPLYGPGDFDMSAGRMLPPLRVDFGASMGCVVLTGTHVPKGASQAQRVGYALKQLEGRLGDSGSGGRTVNPEPVWIRVEDALASSSAYERTVRALCEAEIAVFDITGFEAAVMLFLGVRAAVRRGVTITLKEQGQSALPFNLASINPIAIAKGDAEQIATAMESGLAALLSQPGTYLDLPVFNSIRHVGNDFAPKEPARQILVLRWFETRYDDVVGDVVANELINRFGSKTEIVTTLDSRSPQLLEQRLYADIRRTKVCITDWTGWRPNVFFEIGVRLAVNKIDPIHILCVREPPGWSGDPDPGGVPWPAKVDPSAKVLKDFFAVTEFSIQEPAPLQRRIKEFEINAPNRGTTATLSPGRTYQVVLEALDRRREAGGLSVFEMLSGEAQAMAGPAVPEKGGIPVLFAEELGSQVRRAALEYGFAAWYYLAQRHKLVEFIRAGRVGELDPALVSALQQVGEDLRDRARGAIPAGDKELLDEIFKTLDIIEGLNT